MEDLTIPIQISDFFANQPFDKDLIYYKYQKNPVKRMEKQTGKDGCIYFIADFQTGEFPYLSKRWKSLLDYPAGFWDKGVAAWWRTVHPADMLSLYQILIKWVDFIKIIETEELLNKYSISFKYRIVPKTGKPIHILQQNIYTSLDNKGNIIYNLCRVMNITNLKEKEATSLQIFGINGEKILEYNPKADIDINSTSIFNLYKLLNAKGKNKFIDNVQSIIKENLDNELFSVQDLSDALNLSRAQVYRKILSYTDLSPNAMIRLIRLNEAANLLREKYYNVTEIGYMVGFSNPAYFIKNFKKLYRQTPKEYQRKRISVNDYKLSVA
jgi:AraC-like DNA-binding protein